MKKSANGFVRPHPDNPRYFLFRGEPVLFITSTEHYGAVINLDFDYAAYLAMLKEKGFRLTRIFVFYREQPESASGLEAKDGAYFSELGRQNTLAPAADRYLAPWPRSSKPGCLDGGNTFDLEKWNPAYFKRLKEFCAMAGDLGVVVEVTLFSNLYSDAESGPWRVCPFNAANNINGIGRIKYHEFTGLIDKDVVRAQEALTRKVVNELMDLDNVFFEICNEPNPFPQDPHLEYERIAEWQNHFVALIREIEEGLPARHMIAVCDPTQTNDLKGVSILSFHYREWVSKGLEGFWDRNCAIAFDETLTGIVGWNKPMDFEARRREAWEFVMKGCGVYDYLDFTIATDDPGGIGDALFPGGQRFNGETMRLYLMHLNDFMSGLDFVRMKPDASVIRGRYSAASVYALAEKGGSCAVYIDGCSVKSLELLLPEGTYTAEWFDPRTGKRTRAGGVSGGNLSLEVPLYGPDIALALVRKG